jgi:hypothetical protein
LIFFIVDSQQEQKENQESVNHEKGPEVTSFVTNENYFATALSRYVLDNKKILLI